MLIQDIPGHNNISQLPGHSLLHCSIHIALCSFFHIFQIYKLKSNVDKTTDEKNKAFQNFSFKTIQICEKIITNFSILHFGKLQANHHISFTQHPFIIPLDVLLKMKSELYWFHRFHIYYLELAKPEILR